ncbi:MAG: HAD family hydrolase [Cellulomonadaceae bacterium]|jgi:HAD superfamily hydrolase (TIGR01549 family)|nr:HAD family hydrolase [Cellulomonadaceae bacterium]
MENIRAVVFDVGETLIDESRIWLRWADYLGVPPATLLGLLGAAVGRNEAVKDYFALVRPGFEWDQALQQWEREQPDSLQASFDKEDLYPDVLETLGALKALGYKVFISGNQPPQATPQLEAMALPVDIIWNSADMGHEKPASEFFDKVIELADCAPTQIVYVGDRFDNDVVPALKAGLKPVMLRRGVWGYLQAGQAQELGVPVIDSLAELLDILA